MGWADYLSRSPTGKAPPISTYDASFSVAVCRQIRSIFTQCFDRAHECTGPPANQNARTRSFVHPTMHADTRACLLSLQPTRSNCFSHSVYTRVSCSHLQMPSPLRNFFSWRSPPSSTPHAPDSSSAVTLPDPPDTTVPPPVLPEPPLHCSVATQGDLSPPDPNALTVAVLQAVHHLRPRTSEAAMMTTPTRVGDHFSPELIRALTAADAELSGLIDLLSTTPPGVGKDETPRQTQQSLALCTPFTPH